MKLSRKQIIKIIITLLFFACMLYANFYAVRKMGNYGVELYFYDKLSVAHDMDGKKGIEEELNKVLTSDKFPKELALARAFEGQLKNLKDPAAYIDARLAESTNKITLIKNLRTIAIALMFFIFIWRMFLNISGRLKQKTNQAQ